MFNEGDRVCIRSNGAAGEVVYAEDNYYSVELDNGAEMDFEDVNLLMPEDEYQIEQSAKFKAMAEPRSTKKSASNFPELADLPYVPRKGDRRLASTVIEMIDRIYPGVIAAMETRNPWFNTMDAFDKVKYLSQSVGTPMVVFMGAAEMGDDGMMRQVIGKTVLNDMFGDGTLTMDMLLGTVRRVTTKHGEDE